MLATPAVVMPLTQTFAGRSSMKAPVQSPAREMVSRKPGWAGCGDVGEGVPLLQRAAADRRGGAREGGLAVVEAGQHDVGGGAFEAYGDLAQPEPGQGDAEGDDREDGHLEGAGAGEEGVGPEEEQGGPAAEAVDPLEVVVVAGPEGRQGRGHDERQEGQQGPADRHEGDIAGPDGQGQEPGRARQCPAHVQAAEVVDLPERPADLQGPARRSRSRQPEQEVDDVLLADDDGQGQVDERRVAHGPRRGRPTRVQEKEVGRDDQGRQPVVVHQAGVLEQPAGPRGERGEVDVLPLERGGHRTAPSRLARAPSRAVRSSAALSILPRSVSGRDGRGMTDSGTQ
ncbi:hypothetical protein RKD19_005554 [Streptomyces canus]